MTCATIRCAVRRISTLKAFGAVAALVATRLWRSPPTEKDVYGSPKRIGSRLEIDKEQAKIVRESFEHYAHGASVQGIAADLNERKAPSPGSTWNRTKGRCAGWAQSGISQMLRNPLYGGTYYWKKTQWIKPEGGSRVAKLRKKDEWMHRDAPEFAIVKPAVWKLVQVRLSVMHSMPFRRSSSARDDSLRRGVGRSRPRRAA